MRIIDFIAGLAGKGLGFIKWVASPDELGFDNPASEDRGRSFLRSLFSLERPEEQASLPGNGARSLMVEMLRPEPLEREEADLPRPGNGSIARALFSLDELELEDSRPPHAGTVSFLARLFMPEPLERYGETPSGPARAGFVRYIFSPEKLGRDEAVRARKPWFSSWLFGMETLGESSEDSSEN